MVIDSAQEKLLQAQAARREILDRMAAGEASPEERRKISALNRQIVFYETQIENPRGWDDLFRS